MTELQDKLLTIDELSKAYQRIASVGIRAYADSSSQEEELLFKISDVVKTIVV